MIYQGKVTMAFKQGCFIRKNTPELRAQLEKLGYEYSGFYKVDFSVLATTACNSHYSCVTDVLMDHPDDRIHWRNNRIDCGTNEKMFLALAAMRDDNDYMQWFICDDGESMFQVDKPGMSVEKYIHEYMDGWDTEGYRKATAKEIVEHFNN